MMKTMAHSPALLEGYLAFSGALNKGVLSEVIRSRSRLSSASKWLRILPIGSHADRPPCCLNREQVLLARQGQAQDAKQQAVLNLVQNILDWRGDVSNEQFVAAKEVGLSDAEIAEVVGHVALTR